MTNEMIEAIAEIICTECDGVSFASLPESVKFLECRADNGRAIADKDSARIIVSEILEKVYEAIFEATEKMVTAGDNHMHTASPRKIWQAMLAVSPIAPVK